MQNFLSGFIQLSPLWIISLTAFIPLILKVLNNNKEITKSFVISFHAIGILISIYLLFALGFDGDQALSLKFDSYGTLACLILSLAAFQSLLLFDFNSWLDKGQITEILFLFSHGLLALYVLCLSQDLMTAFLGLEMASLIVYINLALSRRDKLCLESAMKYFVLSAFAGVIFLYGLSFLFGAVGSLQFEDFFSSQVSSYNRFFFLGFTLVFVGLFFKVALFPFQFWLADVYQGTFTSMTCFMATVFKSAIVLFIGRLFSLPFFEKGEHGFILVSGLAVASVLTVLFGNIMALNQTKIKKVVAFSSIAHSGYMMMALVGILSLEGDFKNLSPLVYYLLSYIFMTGGLLTVIQCLETKETSQVELKDFRGLFRKNPLVAICGSLFLIGLAGLPPTFGFFGKLGLLQPLVMSGSWWILVWAFVGSAIGLYYYIKPITIMLQSDVVQGSASQSSVSKDAASQSHILKNKSGGLNNKLVLPFSAKFLLGFTAFGSLFGAFGFGFFF